MLRTILISMLDGFLFWLGIVWFFWLGYSRFVWKWPVAFGAIWMLISFVHLSLISALKRQAVEPASEVERAEHELRKPSPAVTLCFVGISCVVGIIILLTMTLNPLAPTDNRRPFYFRESGEIRCSLVRSVLGSLAAAERERSLRRL